MKFKQIAVGQYKGTNSQSSLSFVVIALSEEGNVYQYRYGRGWVPIAEDTASYPKSKAKDDEPW